MLLCKGLGYLKKITWKFCFYYLIALWLFSITLLEIQERLTSLSYLLVNISLLWCLFFWLLQHVVMMDMVPGGHCYVTKLHLLFSFLFLGSWPFHKHCFLFVSSAPAPGCCLTHLFICWSRTVLGLRKCRVQYFFVSASFSFYQMTLNLFAILLCQHTDIEVWSCLGTH